MLSDSSRSVDLAAIGPDDLWVVWSRPPGFLQDLGEPAVRVHWVLASPGQQGLEEIAGPQGFPTSFIAAASLNTLRQVAKSLPPVKPTALPRWVQKALGQSDPVVVAKLPDGSLAAMGPGLTHDSVVLQGEREDFLAALATGERLLKTHDWKEIEDDLRPAGQDQPIKWLYRQRDPEAARVLQDFLSEGAP